MATSNDHLDQMEAHIMEICELFTKSIEEISRQITNQTSGSVNHRDRHDRDVGYNSGRQHGDCDGGFPHMKVEFPRWGAEIRPDEFNRRRNFFASIVLQTMQQRLRLLSLALRGMLPSSMIGTSSAIESLAGMSLLMAF